MPAAPAAADGHLIKKNFTLYTCHAESDWYPSSLSSSEDREKRGISPH
jgi:hypothetical protein